MSGLVEAIGTVFSSVATTVSNVGSAVMGAGASMFSAVSSGMTGALSGTLGNVVAGALTQGAIGALVGGGISALTGGSFGRGALIGGLGGALSGGLMGAAGLNANPFAQGFGQPLAGSVPGAATPTATAQTGVTAAPRVSNAFQPGDFGGSINGPVGGPQYVGSQAVAGGSTMNAPTGQNFSSFGHNLTTGQAWSTAANQPASAAGAAGPAAPLTQTAPQAAGQAPGWMGPTLANAGAALLTGMAASDQRKAALARDEAQRQFRREEQQRITDSYRVNPAALPGGGGRSVAGGRPTPAQRFARPRYEPVWDPQQGRIVYIAQA